MYRALPHRYAPVVSLLLALAVCAAPAAAQRYYSAQIGVATHAVHDVYSYSDCIGPSYSEFDSTLTLGTLTMVQSFPLIMQNGLWIPQTSSAAGPTSEGEGQATFVSALSATGIVTTWEYGSYLIGAETASVTSIETVDLNTGKYSWSRTINQSTSGSCPGSKIETEVQTASLPITLGASSAPTHATLGIFNPFAPFVSTLGGPTSIDATTILSAPPAGALAADGLSAVVVAVQTNSNAPVTLNLAAPGLLATAPYGSLSGFTATYLTNPSPSGTTSLTVNTPVYCTGTNTGCVFVALLWSPPNMPESNSDLNAGNFRKVTLSMSAIQNAAIVGQTAVVLVPPPLLLVHDIWSSADQAWPQLSGYMPWTAARYPHNLISRLDYGLVNANLFSDSTIQTLLLSSIENSLGSAANAGVAARQIDVVAHGEGGLVIRSFLNSGPIAPSPCLPANPFHTLITIGTPHTGSALASWLNTNANTVASSGSLASAICGSSGISNCTVSNLFSFLGQPFGAGLTGLVTGLPNPSSEYNTIVGIAPVVSTSGSELNGLLGSFAPGQSLTTILGSGQDNFSSIDNQALGGAQVAQLAGIVHKAFAASDIGETFSPDVWVQTLYWLMGGVGGTYDSGSTTVTQAPLSQITLSGYSQTASSNVSFTPSLNYTLPGNIPTVIYAASPSKTISRFLLFQKGAQPADTPLLYATQAPFGIPFTPNRIGVVNFVAIVFFTDNTYTVTPLQYSVAPNGAAIDLQLCNVPKANLAVGSNAVILTKAAYSDGSLNVTSLATYTARSQTANVFSISPGGSITGLGPGVDWLDVSFRGLSISTQIAVGSCSYQLSPLSQLVSNTGGTATVQVATTSSCSWTIDNAANPWLSATAVSGKGSGTLTFTAPANTSGATRTAFLNLNGQDVAVIQSATACAANVSQTQISAPVTGTSGTLNVSSSCPSVVSSNAPWITPIDLGTSIDYLIAPNPTSQQRSATLTVANQFIPVSQAGPCIYSLGQTTGNANGAGDTGSIAVTAGGGCAWTAASNASWITIGSGASGTGNGTVAYIAAANGTSSPRTGTLTIAGQTFTLTQAAPPINTNALQFIAITPCRLVDTRNAVGPFGGPLLSAGSTRSFVVPNASCSIPASAVAYSLNVTVIPPAALSFLTIWPTGQSEPLVSTLNSDGRVKANAAIVPAGTGGAVSVFVSDATHLILDISGYFVPAGTSSALSFYPLAPCRIVDSRGATGPLGGPFLNAGSTPNI